MEKEDAHKVMKRLLDSNYQAYIVGGAVRDSELGKKPKDYDIATDALPEEVLGLFSGSKLINAAFSVSVAVPVNGEYIEVVTMRMEGDYNGGRPRNYKFVKDIYIDLARRDFTINAMAEDINGVIFDPHHGLKDLVDKQIRAVGSPVARIREHPIRMMRARRFSAGLGFEVVPTLQDAIEDNYGLIVMEKPEAISAELMKGLRVNAISTYVSALGYSGLLGAIMPEISAIRKQDQNIHHKGSVWIHTLRSLYYTTSYTPLQRLAVLLHDIGKPKTAAWRGDDYGYSFHGHEKVGAAMAEKICQRLRLPNRDTERVYLAVRWHMYDPNNEKLAKRFLNKLNGNKNLSRDDLADLADFVLSVREADGLGHKKPPDDVYASRDAVFAVLDDLSPFTVKDLAIDGNDVMEALGIPEGPIVGDVLNHLLDLVVDGKLQNDGRVLLSAAGVYNGVPDGIVA